jgi:hypothetical protein
LSFMKYRSPLVAGAVALIALVYLALLVWGVGPLNAFWSSDQGVKLIQTQSLILTRFQTGALVYPGRAIDTGERFTPLRGQYLTRDGQTFAMFPQAFPALSALPFFALGYPGLYLAPFLAGVGTVIAIAVLSSGLMRAETRAILLLAAGLGSPLMFYAVTFWEHAPAIFLTTWALVAVAYGIDRGRLWAFGLAGLLLGLATWLRNEAALCAPALGLALLLHARSSWFIRLLVFGCGLAIGLAPLLAYNMVTYGNALGAHVLVAGANSRLALGAWIDLLIVPLRQPGVPVTVAVLGLLAVVRAVRPRLLTARAQTALMAVGLGALALQLGMGSGLGLTSFITACPIILLALMLGPPAQPALPPRIGLLLTFGLTFILLCLIVRLPDGGAQHGPRMLLPALPALLVAGAWSVERWLAELQHQSVRFGLVIAALVLIVQVSLQAQVAGIQQLQTVTTRNHQLLTTVAQSEAPVIVTDVWYGPPLVAQLFYDRHLVFLAGDDRELDALLAGLIAHGERRLYYLGSRELPLSEPGSPAAQLRPVGERASLPHRLYGQLFDVVPR